VTAKKKPAKKTSTKPARRVPGSMADQINNLEVGGSVATSERFDLEQPDLLSAADLLNSLKKMRNTLAAYVARITEELDARVFKVESGSFITEDKTAILVIATVSRLD
jgi:hypothetical protein